jgi:hypothetical protein
MMEHHRPRKRPVPDREKASENPPERHLSSDDYDNDSAALMLKHAIKFGLFS